MWAELINTRFNNYTHASTIEWLHTVYADVKYILIQCFCFTSLVAEVRNLLYMITVNKMNFYINVLIMTDWLVQMVCEIVIYFSKNNSIWINYLVPCQNELALE